MLQRNFFILIVGLILLGCASQKQEKPDSKYSYRGWNILSNHRENGLKTLDAAAKYGINHIELSHYQLCHDLKDLKNEKKRNDVNFFIEEAHKRGIEDVFVWDHAFYHLDYYPDRFKVESDQEQDLTHHTKHFEGGINKQLDLDNPEFWEWVYQDYDTLLSYAPELDGVVLTFIETGSYVLYQHSDKMKTGGEKIAALVDSLGGYFIDKKGLKLTIRTFIYNQFEKDNIIEALKKIKRDDITVMIKMVPHDWFMTYPYQDYLADIPFPVVIEYDCGMEYAGENVILNTFPEYFADAFKYYHQFENVTGFCARSDRFEETAAVGTPGELNLYLLSELAENPDMSHNEITSNFIRNTYGEQVLTPIKPLFDSAWNTIMASMYTMGTHTANHSRLNYHRDNIYQTHTTGEWYPVNQQISTIKHGVNKDLHNYKDVINRLAFPKFKTDTVGLRKDISWVLDAGWLNPGEEMNEEFLNDIITEKQYAVNLAEEAMQQFEKAKPFIEDKKVADNLYHTINRTVIFTRERMAMAQAVYGYRLWSRGKEYQTPALQQLIWDGLTLGSEMLDRIDNYPVHTPLGQWRWTRDRESFDVYYKAIAETGWKEFGLEGIIVPKP
ncbi:hypothetical protein [Flexithrix dorotheae]|uniref:hypothetical protein n=1 Tax=Flexithrix dorotheae TaxID=70993 RepID=UPI0003798160|nr:hypothetical protein [Flexithrix dorotheae]